MATKKQVNKLAARFGCRIYRIIENHGVMCQMVEETETWQGQWSIGWYESEQEALDATYKHLKECEEMNIFKTELFKYLEGLMIKDKPVTLTIKKVTIDEVSNGKTTENKPIIHFEESDKMYIPNKTSVKQIVTFFGGETNDWIGKRITLYAEFGKWFGKEGWAVRISEKLPSQKKPTNAADEPTITDNALQTSIDEAIIVTAEQAELIATTDPGAFE